jgi:hypothetical protein
MTPSASGVLHQDHRRRHAPSPLQQIRDHRQNVFPILFEALDQAALQIDHH